MNVIAISKEGVVGIGEHHYAMKGKAPINVPTFNRFSESLKEESQISSPLKYTKHRGHYEKVFLSPNSS
jgi:hypothetical protein